MNSLLNQKIIISGDIHHMSMNGHDQILLGEKSSVTEVTLCEPFLELVNHYGFKPILFFTAHCVIEEYALIKKLINNYQFYIGGHTYSAYRPKIIFRALYKLFGTYYPIQYLQNLDISLTKKVFREKLDLEIDIWRNHAYFNDKNTNKILLKNGFKIVSNLVDLDQYIPFLDEGILKLPINTFPDHEYLSHSNDHNVNWTIQKWYESNISQIKKILLKGGKPTLLTHPLCLYLENNFKNFDQFLSTINKLSHN